MGKNGRWQLQSENIFFNFWSFSIFPNCQRHPCQNSACHGHSYYEKNRFKVKLFYKLLLWKKKFSLPPIAGQILGLLDRLSPAVSIDIISWCTFVHFGGYNRWKILLHSATSDGWWPALSSTAEEDQIRGRGKGYRSSYDLVDSNPALCTSFSCYIFLEFFC